MKWEVDFKKPHNMRNIIYYVILSTTLNSMSQIKLYFKYFLNFPNEF